MEQYEKKCIICLIFPAIKVFSLIFVKKYCPELFPGELRSELNSLSVKYVTYFYFRSFHIFCAEDLALRISGIRTSIPEPGQKVTKAQKKTLASGKLIEGIRIDTVPLVKRVDYRLDTEFLDEHSLIIQNESDLEIIVVKYSDILLLST
jgi:hypothetical protein